MGEVTGVPEEDGLQGQEERMAPSIPRELGELADRFECGRWVGYRLYIGPYRRLPIADAQ